jgi:acetoin utilization deacetylase AcuC-like enzyme
MLIFYDPNHALHAPEFEFYRGQRVPCFETPSRAEFVFDALIKSRHNLQVPSIDSQSVIEQIHTARYIQFLSSAWQQWLAFSLGVEGNSQPFPSVWPVRSLRSDLEPANFIAKLGLYSMDNGTPLAAGTWQVAKTAADAAASAAYELVSRQLPAVFCATRPPGHHAGADFMGGYCFLNNAAIAAQKLRNLGLSKVAIVDVDFHHGNGTQEIFYQRADVLYTSVHGTPATEFPFYLGYADEHGFAAGLGANFNIPLPAQTSSLEWFAALSQLLETTGAFAPNALVVSLGLDTFINDPISQFKLTTGDFFQLGRCIATMRLPTIFILEGGYAAASLGLNACQVLAGFESVEAPRQ